MKNLLILFCSLLILAGVFGADEVKVSVKEGDSVTLEIKSEEIKGAEELKWKFNNTGSVIAKIDLEVNDSPAQYPDNERFTDRLKLDPQTGSLTITHIRTQHSGEYTLEIKRIKTTYKIFRVSVSDKVSLSVMEGDSVTLQTDVTDVKSDDVKWKFNGADVTESRFKNIKENPQTGNLKITNITRDQFGEYKVEIHGRSFFIHRTISVIVSDEMSVMERDSVTLSTGVTVGKRDDVKWKFNGADLTESRFKNIEVNNQTGNLKITNIRRDQSGEYKVEINGSSFIHKTFSVNVSDQSSLWVITVAGVLGLVVLVVVSYGLYKYCKKKN